MIYQHAHLLKNLTAIGLEDGKKTEGPLSWADRLAHANLLFAKQYKVVLLDEKSGFNPGGAVDQLSPSRKLKSDGFLATYRDGTIRRTNADDTIADAFISLTP